MQDKGLDFKHKEVVNIKDGKRLGYVQDVCADLETGVITSIIVPGSNKFMNIFSSNNDIALSSSIFSFLLNSTNTYLFPFKDLNLFFNNKFEVSGVINISDPKYKSIFFCLAISLIFK